MMDWWTGYRHSSPAQYYLVLFLWAWVILFAAFTVLSHSYSWGAKGDTVTVELVNQAPDTGVAGEYHACVRGPDGILRYAFVDNSSELAIAHSHNNGTTWTQETLIASGWKGYTSLVCGGVYVSTNNTTVVLFYTVDADSKYDIYLQILWGWQGSWENIHVEDDPSTAYLYVTGCINYLDEVLITYSYSNINYYKTYFIANKTLYPAEGSTGTLFLNLGGQFRMVPVANLTGRFWMVWCRNPSSTVNIYFQPLDKSLTARTVDTGQSTVAFTLGGAVCYPNGVIATITRLQYLTNYGIWYYYLQPTKSTGSMVQIFFGASKGPIGQGCSLSCDATNTGYITYYDDVGDDFRMMYADYDAGVDDWLDTDAVVYSTPGATDAGYVFQGPSTLWPKVFGVSFNMPVTGCAVAWDYKDEVGATDDYRYQLYRGSPVWSTIDFQAVRIGNTNLSAATFYRANYLYWDFTVTGGNAPYTWSLDDLGNYTGTLDISIDDGELYGTCPNATGWFAINVSVEDQYGNTDTANVLIPIQNLTAGEEVVPEGDDWSKPNLPHPSTWWPLFLIILALVVTGMIITGFSGGRV